MKTSTTKQQNKNNTHFENRRQKTYKKTSNNYVSVKIN